MFSFYIAHMHRTTMVKCGVSENIEARLDNLYSRFGHVFTSLFSIPIPDTSWNSGRMFPATAVETLVRRQFPNTYGGIVPTNSREFYNMELAIPIADFVRKIVSEKRHLKRDYNGRVCSYRIDTSLYD